MAELQNKKITEMTDSEFTALLRAKAENTPIPLSMEPQFILNRLPKKKTPTLWERLAPMACAAAACIALVVTGNSGINEYLYCSRDYLTAATAEEIAYYRETGKMYGLDDEEYMSHRDDTAERLSAAPKKTGIVAEIFGKIVAPIAESSTPSSEEISDPVSEIIPDTSDPSEVSDTSEPVSEPIIGGEESDPVSDPVSEDVSSQSGEEENSTDTSSEDGIPEEPEDLTYAGYFDTLIYGDEPGSGERYLDTTDLRQVSRMTGQGSVSAFNGRVGYYLKDLANGGTILSVTADGTVRKTSTAVEYLFPQYYDKELLLVEAKELFLRNDILAVAAEAIFYGDGGAGILTSVSLYDVSDPLSPVYLNTFSQSGSYLGGRLTKEGFVLASDHRPSDAVIGDPVSYMPFRHFGEDEELLGHCIDQSELAYAGCTVVTLFNTEEYLDSRVLFGGGKSIYLGETGVYLFDEGYDETFVSKYAVSEGTLTFMGETSVWGSLVAEASPVNEYKGQLRLFTTDGYDFFVTVLGTEMQREVSYSEPLADMSITGLYYEGGRFYLTVDEHNTFGYRFSKLGEHLMLIDGMSGCEDFIVTNTGFMASGELFGGSSLVHFTYDETGALVKASEQMITSGAAEATALCSGDGWYGGCFNEGGVYSYYLYRIDETGTLQVSLFNCGGNRIDHAVIDGSNLILMAEHSTVLVDIATATAISAISY